jgi:hypothetical protein
MSRVQPSRRRPSGRAEAPRPAPEAPRRNETRTPPLFGPASVRAGSGETLGSTALATYRYFSLLTGPSHKPTARRSRSHSQPSPCERSDSMRGLSHELGAGSAPTVGNRSLLAGGVIGPRSKTTDRPLAPGTAPEALGRANGEFECTRTVESDGYPTPPTPKSPSLGSEGEAASTDPPEIAASVALGIRFGLPRGESRRPRDRLAGPVTATRESPLARRNAAQSTSTSGPQPVPDAARSPSLRPRPSRGPRCRIWLQSTRPLRPRAPLSIWHRLGRDRSGDPKCADPASASEKHMDNRTFSRAVWGHRASLGARLS